MIATTLVLVAVFVPIAFMEGNLGRLFSEFSLAIAGAVCFSSLVALTLVPMAASKLLRPAKGRSGPAALVDRGFARFSTIYSGSLGGLIQRPLWVSVFLLAIVGAGYPISKYVQEEMRRAEAIGKLLDEASDARQKRFKTSRALCVSARVGRASAPFQPRDGDVPAGRRR